MINNLIKITRKTIKLNILMLKISDVSFIKFKLKGH